VELDDGGWRWLSGIFLSIVFLAIVAPDSISSCTVPPPGVGPVSASWCVEAWINRYQTLIAGLFALGGALLTVAKLSAQIKQTSDSEADRRERQEIASRAKLLMALNILSKYSESCIKQIATLHSQDPLGTKIIVPDKFELPELPTHAVAAMEGCLEYTQKDRINAVRGVLAWLQIQHARIVDDSRLRKSITARDNALFDAVQLRVLTDKLFNYARKRQDDSTDRTINQEDFTRTVFFFNITKLEFSHFFDLVKQTNWSALEEYL
jgi:hypothetical protein